ncbi:Similar to Cc_odve66_1 [Cotesia congregata]|uniref:Similar to Cc_odve66_1 n=1 Tax=Cotesia congregata TaxID=51543 RepID=A0A8J2HE95_COTCN|nr:Similar to Cc_odve66_1 [Cotesia congregata]
MIFIIISIIIVFVVGTLVTVQVIVPALTEDSKPVPKEQEQLPTPEARTSTEPQPLTQHSSGPQLTIQKPISKLSNSDNLENQLLAEMQGDAPQAESQVLTEVQHSVEPKETVLSRLQLSLKNIYNMPSEYQAIADQYIKNMDQVYQDTFTLEDHPNMDKITSFGIALLHQYANDSKQTYLPIVEHLISKINEQLPQGNELVHLPTKWNQKYYFFCVRLTRMLAMFEILSTNESIKTICHQRIYQITPFLWKSLEWDHLMGIQNAWIAIPRLITNFLKETKTYEKETQPNHIGTLKQIMKVEFLKNIDAINLDGIWIEKSCIFNGVATYWPLVESGTFYASVFRALGFEADIDDVTQKILDKILHPSMDIIPLGLFGRQSDIRITKTLKTNWSNYQRKAGLDIGIFPVAGLGVFKSKDFAFWVRVQRWYIAGYEADQVDFELAGGWIQMRKLYLKSIEQSYESMTWQKIKMQPGVISNEDGSDDFEYMKPQKEEKANYPMDVISHVGTLMDEGRRVLYWKNEYKFKSLFGMSKITEFGVCTDNGLVMQMEVLNKTDKILKIRIKDDDAHGMEFDCRCSDSNQKCNNGFVTVGKNDSIVVNWRQVFKKEEDDHPQEVTRTTKGHMTFKFGGDDYVIESRDKLHFVIKNSQVLLAGSFEKSLSYIIEYGYKNRAIKFEFNPNTLMYKAII